MKTNRFLFAVTLKVICGSFICGSLLLGCGGKTPPVKTAPVARKVKKSNELRPKGKDVMVGVPKIPASYGTKLNRYLSARGSFFSDWEDNGTGMLVRTRFDQNTQVCQVSHPGGARRQITFSEQPALDAWSVPGSYDGALLLERLGTDGASSELVRFDVLEATFAKLSGSDGARTTEICWSTGGQLAFNSNARNGKDFDVYVSEAKSRGQERLVHAATGYSAPLDFSPDGSQLLVRLQGTGNGSQLGIIEVASGEFTPIPLPSSADEINSDGGGKVDDADEVQVGGAGINCGAKMVARWASNGKNVFLTSNHGGEFFQLYRYDLKKQRLDQLTDVEGDIDDFDVSVDGRTLMYVVNEGGYSGLFIASVSRRSFRPSRVDIGKAVLSDLKFSRNRKHSSLVGFTLSRPTAPADVYSYNTRTKKLTRWTQSAVGGLNADFFVEPRVIEYPASDTIDGQPHKISAFYYKPPGSGPYPVLVYLHGGPRAQFRPKFRALFQYLLMDAGVAIIAPNVRGSTGRGKSYARRDDRENREMAISDVGALLHWIEGNTELDAARVVLFGKSYGGFLALASMAQYDRRVRGAIDIAGMSFLPAFLKNSPPYMATSRRMEFGDERDSGHLTYLKKVSPLLSYKKLKAPLLVIHGAKDKQVQLQQSEQLVKRLRKIAPEHVWYFVAHDEGHRFYQRKSEAMQHLLTIRFLDTLLNEKKASGKDDAGILPMNQQQ